MQILVVEDDESVAAGVLEGLTRAGFQARHVADGAGALAEVRSSSPDFVLLDLGLPDMDGTDVCRSIRSLTQTPIIIVSARDEEIDRVLALELGGRLPGEAVRDARAGRPDPGGGPAHGRPAIRDHPAG